MLSNQIFIKVSLFAKSFRIWKFSCWNREYCKC